MPEVPTYDVFVSYAEADRAWVEGYLLAALEQAGVQCMYESAFALGVPRLLEFERSIKQSKRTLLIISAAYLADGLNGFIDTMGQSYGQETNTWPVIPLIRQSVPLPPRLGMLVGLRATNETEQESAIAQLCADLKRPPPAPAPSLDCPYPGMKPFGLGDRDRFFGREKEIGELLERLRLHPFITVIGPSGSGKSSLVFAGLIPALRESRLFGSGGWRIESMRPGETPETTLREALAAETPESARLLLVVDQFEELFTLAKEEPVSFQEGLLKLAKTPNVYLVLTVRADFYAELMTSLLWQEIQNYRLEVVPLTKTGLQDAILKPAETMGVFVEAALVERLMTDAAGEPGVLPLIQETLVLLWQRLERRFLPLRAYEAIVLSRSAYGGQETGQKTGLQVAIARRADQAIKELQDDPEQQQAIVRRIFLRLIQFGEGRADTRRQQPIDALQAVTDDPALFNKTLGHLVDCRLLTLSGNADDSARKVDIAHEALITGWPQLQQWITERRELEQTRRRLSAKAEEWVRLGQGAGGLLDRVELAETQRWLESPDARELGYTGVFPKLVQISLETIEADEQRQLQLERKARKSAQRFNWIAGISLVLLTGLTTYAFIQRNQSEKNRQEAEQQSIISQARTTETLFTTDQQLEALISGLKAAKQLRRNSEELPVLIQLILALQKVVYGIREQNRLEGHTNWVLGVDISPDSQTIASASADKTIRLWKADGSSLLKPLKGHTDSVVEVNFNPNGRVLVSASSDKTIRFWNVIDGQPIGQPIQVGDWIANVRFSSDGQFIAAACTNKVVKLWRVSDHKSFPSLQGHTAKVTDISFSPDRQHLASVSEDGTIRLWNFRSGKAEKSIQGQSGKLYGVSFSPKGQAIVTAGEDNTVKLWAVHDGHLIRTLQGHRDVVLNVQFSKDGQAIVSASKDGTIKLWSLDGRLLQNFQGHREAVGSVRFSSNEMFLVSGSNDKTVRIWNRNANSSVVLTHQSPINSVQFSSDGHQIISAAEDGTIGLWQRNGKPLPSRLLKEEPLSTAIFSPIDNQTVATGVGATIKLWNLDRGSPKVLTGHQNTVSTLSFSPNGQLIVSGSLDKTLRLWRLDGTPLGQPLQGHTDRINSVSFNPDGNLIASGSSDKTIRLWTVDGKTVEPPLKGHTDSVLAVTFSPDGKELASASSDKTIRLWSRNGNQFEPLGSTLQGHSGGVYGISFSPDGTILASASSDGSIRFWSADGEFLQKLQGQDSIYSLNFSSSGKALVSAGFDGTAHVWNLDLDDLISRGCLWIQDYLKNNPNLTQRDRNLCNGD